MWVPQEHIGPIISKEIQMYILTRAELLFTLCYEIPCMTIHKVEVLGYIWSCSQFYTYSCLLNKRTNFDTDLF